jgi:hypothetical protein
VPIDWENKSLKFMTNRWLLSVLFKYEIPKDATELDIKNKWRPLFPPLSDPNSWFNVTKAEIDSVRRVVYKDIVPSFALGLVSGHCWRGGQTAPCSFVIHGHRRASLLAANRWHFHGGSRAAKY